MNITKTNCNSPNFIKITQGLSSLALFIDLHVFTFIFVTRAIEYFPIKLVLRFNVSTSLKGGDKV